MILDDLRAIDFSTPDTRPQWLKNLGGNTDYYRLLYEICRRYVPLNVVEIGTNIGASCVHFAAALAQDDAYHSIITIDHEPWCFEVANAWKLKFLNLQPLLGDSLDPDIVDKCFNINLLFIDGEHSICAYDEFMTYRQRMCPGGIVVMDDIHLTPEMEDVWAWIEDPKLDLSIWHHSGFGVVQIP